MTTAKRKRMDEAAKTTERRPLESYSLLVAIENILHDASEDWEGAADIVDLWIKTDDWCDDVKTAARAMARGFRAAAKKDGMHNVGGRERKSVFTLT